MSSGEVANAMAGKTSPLGLDYPPLGTMVRHGTPRP